MCQFSFGGGQGGTEGGIRGILCCLSEILGGDSGVGKVGKSQLTVGNKLNRRNESKMQENG